MLPNFKFPILDSTGNPTSTFVNMSDMFVPQTSFTDSGLWGWGDNYNSQLSSGNVNSMYSSPVHIGTDSIWQQVDCGPLNASAIKTDGSLWSWGYNAFGQLGTGDTTSYPSPVQIGLLTDWQTVVCGGSHTTAIKTDGTLWGWGNNSVGQLGISTTVWLTQDISVMSQVGAESNWEVVDPSIQQLGSSLGANSAFGITSTGTLWTWGYNTHGELGDGTTVNKSSPVQVGSLTDWKQVAGGFNHTAAIKTDSTLWTWGYNSYGQLGDGTIVMKSSPVQVGSLTDWKKVASGSYHIAAIKTDNTLWAWGSGRSGQTSNVIDGWQTIIDLSYGEVGRDTDWRVVDPDTLIINTTGGGDYLCNFGIKSNGTLWSCGYNGFGQLGTGDTTSYSSPVQVGTATNWKQVASSFGSTLAVDTNGTLWGWGSNSFGELGTGNTTRYLSPVSGVPPQYVLTNVVATATSITNSILGAAALTSDTTHAGDDDYWTLTLPWIFTYLGTSYTTLYVGTNSYITFTAGSTQYSGFSASSPVLPKILIAAADNSAQRIYYGIEGVAPNRTYRIRFEGAATSGGAPLGSPTIVWEAVLYENNTAMIDIQIDNNAQAGGMSGVYSADTMYADAPNSANTGMTITTSATITEIPGIPWTNVESVSAGSSHTATINTDGTLWTCGYNSSGALGDGTTTNKHSPVQVGTLTDWKQVSCGYSHTAAVKTDGTLWTFGGMVGQFDVGNQHLILSPTQMGTDTNWKQVAAGINWTVAIKTNGTMWAHGEQQYTNNDSLSQRFSTLTQIGTATDWKQVAAGDNMTSAVKTTGTLWAWGLNFIGYFGTGDQISSSSPVQIGSDTNWIQVACPGKVTTAWKSDGTLWSCGDGREGALGRFGPIGADCSSPIQVGSLTDWKQVACGNDHTASVKTDGTLWTCGYNNDGQLGDGTTVPKSSPVQVGTLTDWKQVSAGFGQTAATKTDGTLWTWGYNGFGALGDGTGTNQSSPVQVGSLTDWKHVVCGGYHTAAIKTDGTLWTFGLNNCGQLGSGTSILEWSPVQVGSLTDWIQVTCRYETTQATRSNGTMWSCGYGGSGQLGTEGQILQDYSSPVQISSLANWNQISCGDFHTAAINTTGELWSWGANSVGQLCDGTVVDKLSPVQIGSLSKWQQVSCGHNYTAAIKANNTLWLGGLNDYGQLGTSTLGWLTSMQLMLGKFGESADWEVIDPSETLMIAGWGDTVHAIKTDGTLWGCGYNGFGQLGDGTTVDKSSPVQIGSLTDWKQVAGGFGQTAAVKTDGTLWTWGYNYYGQLGDGTTVNQSSPVQIGTATNWIQVGVLRTMTYATNLNNEIWSCGQNAHGCAGVFGDAFRSNTSSFVQVGSMTNWQQVQTSLSSTLAIKTDGTLWAWGSNNCGQLGTNNYADQLTPVQIGLLTNWKHVSVGEYDTAAIKTDGTLWTCGYNSRGQLGLGHTNSSNNLAQVGSDTIWKSVSCGQFTMLAIKSES